MKKRKTPKRKRNWKLLRPKHVPAIIIFLVVLIKSSSLKFYFYFSLLLATHQTLTFLLISLKKRKFLLFSNLFCDDPTKKIGWKEFMPIYIVLINLFSFFSLFWLFYFVFDYFVWKLNNFIFFLSSVGGRLRQVKLLKLKLREIQNQQQTLRNQQPPHQNLVNNLFFTTSVPL